MFINNNFLKKKIKDLILDFSKSPIVGEKIILKETLEKIKETYNLMSQKYFTHATPTLFNSGTLRPQLSSCYLIAMEDDSLGGIFNTLTDCAYISKWAGGI